MAGVAETSQVVSNEKSLVFDGELPPTNLTFNLSDADSVSLQELIDSELALRIGGAMQEVEGGSSELFLEAERTHTTATLNTLNIFSDTIDLSPDCEPISPLFPHTPLNISPHLENKSFDTSDPDISEAFKPVTPVVDSDESPITEDGSELEPIPLFTQTITSDHEQSPLTEVNPFVLDGIEVEDAVSPSVVKSPQIDEVLVVIEPPDDSTPNSNDSPEPVSSPQEILVEEMEVVESLVDVNEEQPLIVIKHEPTIDDESETKYEQESENLHEPKLVLIHEPNSKPELHDLEPQYLHEPEPVLESETVHETEPVHETELVHEPEPVHESKLVNLTNNLEQSESQACLVDSVDASGNSMQRVFVGVVANQGEDSEWTTVEEATKEVEGVEDVEPLLAEGTLPALHVSVLTQSTKHSHLENELFYRTRNILYIIFNKQICLIIYN